MFGLDSETVTENLNVLKDLIKLLLFILSTLLVRFVHLVIPYKKKDVSGQIVLVTGSGHGMGRELALSFAKLNACVVLWDINPQGNEETARQIRASSGTCFEYTCDVSNRGEIYRVAKRVKEEVGEVDILINNAGVVIGKKLLESPDELIEKTFDVNLMALFWTTKSFLPSMLRRNHGHIVNIASTCGIQGLNRLTTYSATKSGVIGFTDTLNLEIKFSGHDQVYTTVVCPSFVTTGMFDGCEMKYPYLLPPLEPKQTVDKIVESVLTNTHYICIPRLVYTVAVLKTILPTDALMESWKFAGADSFMDTFMGYPHKKIPPSLSHGITNGATRNDTRA